MNTITNCKSCSLISFTNEKIKFLVDRTLIIIILIEVIVIFILLLKILNFHYQTGIFGWSIYQSEYKRVLPNENAPNEMSIFWRESDDPIFHGELIPNHYQFFEGFTAKLNRSVIKINSDGFRDREYSIEKPNNTIRIIVLGDSVTFGWGINVSDTYPKVLEKMLNNDLNTTINFEVLNFGVPGFNTLEEIHLLEKKGLKYNPDVVIIGYVAGDAENNTKLKTKEVFIEADKLFKERFYNQNHLSRIEENFYKNELTARLIRDDLIKNFNQNLESYVLKPLEHLKTLSQEKKIKKIIIVFLTDTYQIEKDRIVELANKYNFCVIDAYERLKKYPYDSLILDKKDPHYNSFANQIIAEFIFSKITQNDNQICSVIS